MEFIAYKVSETEMHSSIKGELRRYLREKKLARHWATRGMEFPDLLLSELPQCPLVSWCLHTSIPRPLPFLLNSAYKQMNSGTDQPLNPSTLVHHLVRFHWTWQSTSSSQPAFNKINWCFCLYYSGNWHLFLTYSKHTDTWDFSDVHSAWQWIVGDG